MKKLLFDHTILAGTSFSPKEFPILSVHGKPMPEIACVGRSNVGKSSLINHLTQTDLARTSSVPGKTQSINFYIVDDQIALVDLPGYGYAKVPKDVRAKWAKTIDTYFESRSSLRLILFLLDSRRELNEEDLAFAQWAEAHGKPLLIVFTKADKLTAAERKRNADAVLKSLKSPSIRFLHYSIKDPRARIDLIKNINAAIFHGPHQ